MFKVHNKEPCSSVSFVNFEQVNAGWAVFSPNIEKYGPEET